MSLPDKMLLNKVLEQIIALSRQSRDKSNKTLEIRAVKDCKNLSYLIFST
jgi:hypothetical protein